MKNTMRFLAPIATAVSETKLAVSKMNPLVPASFACLALSACGGSSTSVDPAVAHLVEAATILDIVPELDPLNPNSLPVSGSATYEGGMSIFHKADDFVLGVMTLNVDFSQDSFSGEANRFVDGERTAFDGSIDITEGIIQRDGDFSANYSATALVDGTLTSPDETISVTGFIVGDFAGESGDYYRGFLRIGLNGDTFQDGDPFGGVVGARLTE